MIDNKLDLYNILISPLNTEKSRPQDNQKEVKDQKVKVKSKYVFKVLKSATKKQIKDAFEYCFQKQVEKVNVLNVMGKTKKFKQRIGKRADWKKAYITLKIDQNLDIFDK